jgi:hypothetical protein
LATTSWASLLHLTSEGSASLMHLRIVAAKQRKQSTARGEHEKQGWSVNFGLDWSSEEQQRLNLQAHKRRLL